jgi:hypothetical protein
VNTYLIYINGILMVSDLFSVASQTSATKGRFLQAIASKDDLMKEKEHVGSIRRIDVMEVRASNVIRRYEYVKPEEGDDEDFTNLPANKKSQEPERAGFRLFGVPNAF